jgi:hypothetical protein
MIRPKLQKVANNFRYHIGVKRRLLLKELQIEFSFNADKFLLSDNAALAILKPGATTTYMLVWPARISSLKLGLMNFSASAISCS